MNRGGVFENNLSEQAGLERGVAAIRYGCARAMRTTDCRARTCIRAVNFVSLPWICRPLAFLTQCRPESWPEPRTATSLSSLDKMGKGKKKSATAAAPTTPAVAPVIQKKPAAKSKCTSSEIDDIFGVAKSASASIPQIAPCIANTDSTEPTTTKSKQPNAASSAKQTTSTTSLPDGDEDEDDITDDLQLLAERIRKNRQDKANKVSSVGIQSVGESLKLKRVQQLARLDSWTACRLDVVHMCPCSI